MKTPDIQFMFCFHIDINTVNLVSHRQKSLFQISVPVPKRGKEKRALFLSFSRMLKSILIKKQIKFKYLNPNPSPLSLLISSPVNLDPHKAGA